METQTGTITYIRDAGGVQGRDEFTRTRMDDGSLVVQVSTAIFLDGDSVCGGQVS